jgi:hypothetical protein
MNWFSFDSWNVFNLQSYWLFGARCSVLFVFPYCLISINFTLLIPRALYGRECTLSRGLNTVLCFKFHHFKIIYFQPKVWAAFLLGILSMVVHYRVKIDHVWAVDAKRQIHLLGSGPCLLLQQTSVICQFVCPRTCLAVVYSMCLSVDVVYLDVVLKFQVFFACACWEGWTGVKVKVYSEISKCSYPF